MNKFILASASPRRKELLTQIGLPFEIIKSTCKEHTKYTEPSLIVCDLSRQKAMDVWEKLKQKDCIVIGADTIVCCDGEILGKPEDEKDACGMLKKLSGRSHEVYTGVTLCYRKGTSDNCNTFFEKTIVEFYPMTKQEITAYVETGEPLDKAGAYGIQGKGAAYIKGIMGDYNNVVGLPVGRLYQELKKI